jgi:hypothetical protein
MIRIKYIAFVIAILLMSACSKDEINNGLIAIRPSTINLSAEQPVSYFQLAKGDYDIEGFCISYNVMEEPISISISISKANRKKEQFTIDMPDGNEAKFFCKNGVVQKIDLGFITLSKIAYGKYKIQYYANAQQKKPFSMTIGVAVPEGVSTVNIFFK